MGVRGVIVTYETIRQCCAKFGPVYAATNPFSQRICICPVIDSVGARSPDMADTRSYS